MSPVRNIPSFEETRRRTPARSPERNRNNGGKAQSSEGLLIDFSTPTRGQGSGEGHATNPFEAFNASSAIRDDIAAAQEREEKERRERERKAILEQREARRKSMGRIALAYNVGNPRLMFIQQTAVFHLPRKLRYIHGMSLSWLKIQHHLLPQTQQDAHRL